MAEQRERGISWTNETWNPIRGCSEVDDDCRNCYAKGVAARFSGTVERDGKIVQLPYYGLARRSTKKGLPLWTGVVRSVPEHMTDPLRWQRPRMIFVNSMSDLFHEELTDEQIDEIFGVMWACRFLGRGENYYPGHIFQILTKRARRMRQYLTQPDQKLRERWAHWAVHHGGGNNPDAMFDSVAFSKGPHPRIWLGVSCGNQRVADERIPELLETPAAVRWASAEPLLGPIDFNAIQIPGAQEGLRFSALTYQHDARFGSSDTLLDWVVPGGESGPRARECDVRWIRDIVRDCDAAGVPCFPKQLGEKAIDGSLCDVWANGEHHYTRPAGDPLLEEARQAPGYSITPHKLNRLLRDKKGGDDTEWPEDLRGKRQWPAMAVAA